jgi:PAS domain S-box-containing protein
VNLRTVARISLVALAAGMMLAIWIAVDGWRHATRVRAELVDVAGLRHKVRELQLAVDYVTMLRGDPALLDRAAADAEDLAGELVAIDHPKAPVAARHLSEIAFIARAIGEHGSARSLLDPALARRPGLVDLIRQLQIHENGLTGSFEAIVDDRYRDLSSSLVRDVRHLLLLALIIGVPAVVALALIYFRIRRPLAAFRDGIRRLSAGEEDVHIETGYRDELGELAASFNRMADKLQRRTDSLHRSEARFRQLAEHIRDVFWIYEPGTRRVLYVSPAFPDVFGIEPERIHADPDAWQWVILDEDRPAVADFVAGWTRGACEAQYRIRHPDGSVRWIHDRAFPIRDEQGHVYRIAGVARDVTELVENQITLRERIKEQACLYRSHALTTDDERSTEQICRELVEFLPDYMLHEDDAVARLSVAGQEYRSRDWGAPAVSHRTEVRDGSRPEGWLEVGYRHEHPDQRDGQGPFMAEEIRLLAAVASHVAHMIQSRRTAESLSQTERLHAIGELTGGIAHDFNNLLTVIRGNSELLVEQMGERRAADEAALAQMVLDAAERGADLTQRLLAFARRQPLAPKPVDVNEQIRGMQPLLERTLGKDIRVELNLYDPLWTARVDPAQLETSLLNLAINARDAMPGGGWLTLETRNMALDRVFAEEHDRIEPGQYVQIAVSDTGSGMPADVRGQVFEPFFTTKEKGKGTGLGLSMVYGFVKQSRGHVSVYSEVGKGTTIKLYLPRHGGAGAATPAAEPPAREFDGAGRTVLVAEDDPLVRRYARRTLSAMGFAVLEAPDGRGAAERLAEHPEIDLLLTDVVMPGGMGGPELARRARSLRPELPVIFMSGYAEDAIVHHGELDPSTQLLSKPFRRQDLVGKLVQALGDDGDEQGGERDG